MSKPADLVQRTLDMLILKKLAFEPLNGWAIRRRLNRFTVMSSVAATVPFFPALHKLEHRGWMRA